MNFYQRIIALITFAIIGLTFAIVRVCFEPPYSDIFITECTAIFLGESVVGATLIILCRKKDFLLPYSFSFSGISISYLFFSFIMIFPAVSNIQLKYFVLIHAAGLIFACIGYGILFMGEHNIQDQHVDDSMRLRSRNDLAVKICCIAAEIHDVFPNYPILQKASEKMAEDFRFFEDVRYDNDDMKNAIERKLQALQSAVRSANESECEMILKQLRRLYLQSEMQIKIS